MQSLTILYEIEQHCAVGIFFPAATFFPRPFRPNFRLPFKLAPPYILPKFVGIN